MAGSYITRSGDTWDVIAARALGDELRMDAMLDANAAHNYTVEFDAGVELEVPDLPTPGPTLSPGLPPWRLP